MACLALALGLGACGGSSSAKKSDSTTPARANNTTQNSGGGGGGSSSEPAQVEQDAIVAVRENMLPPVDVGAWVCEPKSWNEKREARLHCVAPTGSGDLIAELKKMTEVVSAEPAN